MKIVYSTRSTYERQCIEIYYSFNIYKKKLALTSAKFCVRLDNQESKNNKKYA